jgi:hypothetical protein
MLTAVQIPIPKKNKNITHFLVDNIAGSMEI